MSGYIFPLITFPYITRILGPASLGVANFAFSVIDYAVLFSTLGMGTIGIREIAKCSDNNEKLNKSFSGLVSLHIVFMTIALIIYLAVVFMTPCLRERYPLYLVGTVKIIFNVFLIEWLFSGLQNFRYITIRSVVTRLLYVIAVFVFVRNSDDYIAYVAVTVLQVFLNATINWRFSKRFVHFSFTIDSLKQYISPVFSMGVTAILLSFYSSFITMYLGFACGDDSVGYYTTATRLYAIIISVISAFNGVLLPHLNSMYGRGDVGGVRNAIEKSINLVVFLSIPLLLYGCLMANDIIAFIAGQQFNRSILPFQIIIVQVFLVGVSQVTELQVLLTFNKMKEIFLCTIASVILSVLIMVLFAKQYAEVAAAYAVMIPHIVECAMLYLFSQRTMKFSFPVKSALYSLMASIPMLIICVVINKSIDSIFLRLILTCIVSFGSYYISMTLFKDEMAGFVSHKFKSMLPVFNKKN